MKLVKNVGIPISEILERSALTSDQIHDLVERYSRTRRDRERWYVDWDLLDAFQEVWQLDDRSDYCKELVKSAKDKTLTKQFYHEQATNANLFHYLDDNVERCSCRWNINMRVAHALLREMLQVTKLEPIPISLDMDERIIWTNKDASAGAIGRGSKEDNRDDCLEAALRLEYLVNFGVPFEEVWIPAVSFHRAQLGHLTKIVDERISYSYEGVMKDRFIWGLDGGTVTFEGKFARPFINHLMNHWYCYAGGDNPEKLRMKIRESRVNKFWISADFSKFDQTVQSWLIEQSFSIVKEFFDSKYHKELDWICHNFIHTWVVFPGGNIIQKHRGIPSGSHFTQVIGSMCNALVMLAYLSSRCKGGSFEEKLSYVRKELYVKPSILGETGKFSMFVMGDDNLLMTRSKVNIIELSKYVERLFGMMIHPEKTDFGDSHEFPLFLKREWRDNGEYREPLELAINVCHPERDREYDGYSCWHIMYGLYLTYTAAFPGAVNERFFIEKMNNHGGIERLRSLNPYDLPGSLRALGNKAGEYLYHHAKNLLGEAA